MPRNRIQKLLLHQEYIDFKDNVVAEAPFIQLDKCGEAIRQVFLGLTENSFIIASETVPDYFRFPSVKYDTEVDLDIEALELEWIVPVGFIDITTEISDRIINIDPRNGMRCHFLISDIWGSAKKDWEIWKEALVEVQSDPYCYTKCLFKDYIIPDKVYDSSIITKRRSEVLERRAKSLETLTNRVMSKMYEIQDEIVEKRKDNKSVEVKSNGGNLISREAESQTTISYGNGRKKKSKKKRKRRSLNKILRQFCLGATPKQRPS